MYDIPPETVRSHRLLSALQDDIKFFIRNSFPKLNWEHPGTVIVDVGTSYPDTAQVRVRPPPHPRHGYAGHP
jgi:hypothetical protein